MHWLELPPPGSNGVPAFLDGAGAAAWLASQPQAQPLRMLEALGEQVRAIDAAAWPGARTLAVLEALRHSIVTLVAAVDSRFLRKSLPLLAEDQRVFTSTQQLLSGLGVAYLRLAAHLPPAEKLVPLHRAAIALRQAEFCHFQAAQEMPPQLDRWLFGILAQAESAGIQRQPIRDPEFPEFAESNIAGHVAWAFLLRLVDPYHLSAAQLAVTNRAFSRWREMAGFQAMPDDDPKARAVPLEPLFGASLPEGVPRWLDVRPVARKMRQRVESLNAGESPESLKLGRELSVAACIRLFHDLDEQLRRQLGTPATEVGEIELLFGADNAYALLAGKSLEVQTLTDKSKAISRQRMEVFGFDRVSQLPNAVKRLNLPSEVWQQIDGQVVRSPSLKARRQSPCLVATPGEGGARLGVLSALRARADESLVARLYWYPWRIEACVLKAAAGGSGRLPAFLMHEEEGLALLVSPSAGVRLNGELALDEAAVERVVPFEVLERGADFVRYACAAV